VLIAVTGATGFVGRRVVMHLAERGHSIVALGRRPARSVDFGPSVLYQQWDLTAPTVRDAPRADVVVHCAGLVSDWGAPAAFEAVNVGGTSAALDAFSGSRFIHISTASVYDALSAKRFVREDAPYTETILNGYVASKIKAEQAVNASARPSVILRPHAIYGPGDTTLVPRALRARRWGCLIVPGDGNGLLSLTHVDNLVHAIECALAVPIDGPETFNVADPLVASVDDILRTFLRAFALSERVLYIPMRVAWPLAAALEAGYRFARAKRPPPFTRYMVSQLAVECTLDISKAVTRLGYSPRRTYENSFPEVATAYRAQ
jgi:2-alkyl-3-oxoalkanoate reductase